MLHNIRVIMRNAEWAFVKRRIIFTDELCTGLINLRKSIQTSKLCKIKTTLRAIYEVIFEKTTIDLLLQRNTWQLGNKSKQKMMLFDTLHDNVKNSTDFTTMVKYGKKLHKMAPFWKQIWEQLERLRCSPTRCQRQYSGMRKSRIKYDQRNVIESRRPHFYENVSEKQREKNRTRKKIVLNYQRALFEHECDITMWIVSTFPRRATVRKKIHSLPRTVRQHYRTESSRLLKTF